MYWEMLNFVDLYLTERRSLRDLETLLLSRLQEILDSGDRAAIELANSLDADLMEFGEAHLDEMALREKFETYLRNAEAVAVRVIGTSRRTLDHMESSGTTLRTRVETPGHVTDLRRQVEFV